MTQIEGAPVRTLARLCEAAWRGLATYGQRSWLRCLLLTLFGSLPLIALTYSLGGVDLSDIAKSYLVMIVAGITFCSVSFYWSTLIRRGVLAQLVSIFTVIFLVAAMPALAMFLTALASNFTNGPSTDFINITFLMLRTNPFAAIADCSTC